MKRAQASLEFLMLIGFMSAVFIVFYAVLSGFLADFRAKENLNMVHDVLEKIKNEVGLANRAYEGYERAFELPLYLDGETYGLTLGLGAGNLITEISITYRDKEQAIPFQSLIYLDPDNDDVASRQLMIKKSEGNGRMYLSFLS